MVFSFPTFPHFAFLFSLVPLTYFAPGWADKQFLVVGSAARATQDDARN